jgi:pimeloyl-ACP methyl ester carboxylesterase
LSTGVSAEILVKEVGSFHVGGREAHIVGAPVKTIPLQAGAEAGKVDPNGEFEVEQMYVNYVKLAKPQSKYPMLLWHTGGMTGAAWETKPDGKPGWQSYFLNKGFDVYTSDAVERGRAAWARFPEINNYEPWFRPKQESWELFRIGPVGSYTRNAAERASFATTKFPTAAFDQFQKQIVPKWFSNDMPTMTAYAAYIEKACPCIIVANGQGAFFALDAATKYPNKIKAVVAMEPGGMPDLSKVNLAAMKNVPHMFIWGDNTAPHPFWGKMWSQSQQYSATLKAAGVPVSMVDLPKMGIKGNSHVPMIDTNSDQVAGFVQKWLEERNLVNGKDDDEKVAGKPERSAPRPKSASNSSSGSAASAAVEAITSPAALSWDSFAKPKKPQ